jgi:hypothetical protein
LKNSGTKFTASHEIAKRSNTTFKGLIQGGKNEKERKKGSETPRIQLSVNAAVFFVGNQSVLDPSDRKIFWRANFGRAFFQNNTKKPKRKKKHFFYY